MESLAPVVVPAPADADQPASGPPPLSAEVARRPPSPHADLPPLELVTARRVWPDLVKKISPSLAWRLSQVEPVAVVAPDVLVIAAKPGYNSVAEACGTPDALKKIEQGLQRLIHRPVSLRYERTLDGGDASPRGRQIETLGAEALLTDPMVQKVVELFEARSIQLEYDDQDRTPED
jgi:DNA polymerase III subunit gamma/tau